MITDWVTHSECTLCKLHGECKKPGIPTRPYDSNQGEHRVALCLIGEAPGFHEDREGKSWVGPAGRYLDFFIEHSKVASLADIYLMNACRCYPASSSNPPSSSVTACKPYLLEELARISNAYEHLVLMLLGATACKSILKGRLSDCWPHQGSETILTLPSKDDPEHHEATRCVWFATYHPAMLLPGRNPEKKFASGQHWLLLYRYLRDGHLTFSNPTITYSTGTAPSWT